MTDRMSHASNTKAPKECDFERDSALGVRKLARLPEESAVELILQDVWMSIE